MELNWNDRPHIPYRDSKLTQILQPSLSGDARVAVIATINPSPAAIEETKSTLKFAQRIKKVVLKAEVREVVDDKALIYKYRSHVGLLAILPSLSVETIKDSDVIETIVIDRLRCWKLNLSWQWLRKVLLLPLLEIQMKKQNEPRWVNWCLATHAPASLFFASSLVLADDLLLWRY